MNIILQKNPTLLLRNFNTARAIASQFTDHTLKPPLTSSQCGAILQQLTNSKSFKHGQSLHAHMISSGILSNNTYISTKLAAFYANCCRVDSAQVLFDEIVLKNSFLWNFMVRGYACSGFPLRGIAVYREMLRSGQKPDKFTYPFVLKACGELFMVEIGRRVHCEVVVRGLESDVYVGNCLLAMYSKFGDMESAWLLFDKMPVRDLTSWNTMVSGYTKNGKCEEALVVFKSMEGSGLVSDSATLLGILSACAKEGLIKQGKSVHGYVVRNDIADCSSFLINAIIDMYCCFRLMVDARQLFDVTCKDTVSWNSMISGYAHDGNALESLSLFSQMVVEGQVPDIATFIAVLEACEHITALSFGMAIHSYIVRKGFSSSTMIATGLISLYAKCGSLAWSHRVFDETKDKNLVCWSAMLAAYGLHGKGRQAVSTFLEMQANNVAPDEGAFTSLLTSCSHAGLVDQGREIFHLMEHKYRIAPGLAHYSCYVDLLSRAGYLYEAYEILKNMDAKPTGDMWATLLSACKSHENATVAELCAKELFEVNPQRPSSYICLSQIYAAENRWDDLEKIIWGSKTLEQILQPSCRSCFRWALVVIYMFLQQVTGIDIRMLSRRQLLYPWKLKWKFQVPLFTCNEVSFADLQMARMTFKIHGKYMLMDTPVFR
ncbi:hypothetical protein Dimus_019757 [Dionaea muscipula]